MYNSEVYVQILYVKIKLYLLNDSLTVAQTYFTQVRVQKLQYNVT